MNADKILILGKIPPPIGGVTIHISRLINSLEQKKYNRFHFLDTSKASILHMFMALMKFPVTHLHTSNVYFQFLAAMLCKVTKKKLIITYHGNLGRYRSFKNMIVNTSCRLCFLPIVQNTASLEKALFWNQNARFLSAYIPELESDLIHPDITQSIIPFRKQYRHLFCTNACNLTFDKSGNETYGVSLLIHKFRTMPTAALIISDPSARYQHFLQSQMTLPENILFIPFEHKFSDILGFSDAFIRNTTTDGDSISVHEALAAKLTVFATNKVPRPAGCILFEDISKIELILELDNPKHVEKDLSPKNVVNELREIYDQSLKNGTGIGSTSKKTKA
jgi:glycosyltransferase involved in cell wall biosynthesis